MFIQCKFTTAAAILWTPSGIAQVGCWKGCTPGSYYWGYMSPWASAQGQMGSATWPPPWKMDEKLKSENMQKKQYSEWGWGWSDTSDDWLVKLMIIIVVIIIDNYPSSRVSLFKFSKFSSSQAALIPLTKILRTPLGCILRLSLSMYAWKYSVIW